MTVDNANAALHGDDWTTNATITTQRSSIVHSARIPAELSERLEAEANRRGTTPSKLICDLVEAGLARTDSGEVVTIRTTDLVEAVIRASHRAA